MSAKLKYFNHVKVIRGSRKGTMGLIVGTKMQKHLIKQDGILYQVVHLVHPLNRNGKPEWIREDILEKVGA